MSIWRLCEAIRQETEAELEVKPFKMMILNMQTNQFMNDSSAITLGAFENTGSYVHIVLLLPNLYCTYSWKRPGTKCRSSATLSALVYLDFSLLFHGFVYFFQPHKWKGGRGWWPPCVVQFCVNKESQKSQCCFNVLAK